jgi:hypothetical protein
MLDPPFLELAYYIGRRDMECALRKIVPDIRRGVVPQKLVLPNLVGLLEKPEELEIMKGVLLLRTEGDAFSGPRGMKRPEARTAGRKAYERFVKTANLLDCPYGAILVEYSLEEPEQLLRDQRSLAFLDFFVSRRYFSEDVAKQIVGLAGASAYVELTGKGIYVSMTEDFNPAGRSVTPDAQERSAQIGTLVGRAFRGACT